MDDEQLQATIQLFYLGEFGKDASAEKFSTGVRSGQRIGQAFYNSLSESDKKILRGSLFDPFFVDDSNVAPFLYSVIDHLVQRKMDADLTPAPDIPYYGD